jgi:hypothetical protein
MIPWYEVMFIGRLLPQSGYSVTSAVLDQWIASLGGDTALVSLVTGHHDVSLHSPGRTPAVRKQIMQVKITQSHFQIFL